MKRNTKILLIIFALIIIFFMFIAVIKSVNRGGGSGGGGFFQRNTNIAYGADSDQKFDFYAPANNQKSNTLIVLVHGGAWFTGDKNGFASHAKFFSQKGYSVVSMNYRLSPFPKPEKDPDWNYREPLEDIASVLNYVANNPSRFKLNQGYKIVLIGHSAGGHLVNLYGLKESSFGGTQKVSEVISLAGPTDFVSLDTAGWEGPAVEIYLNRASLEEASPARNVLLNEQTEYLLVLGLQDQLVPVQQVLIFKRALEEKNAHVETLVLPNRDHNTIQSMIPQNDEVAQKILGFIQN